MGKKLEKLNPSKDIYDIATTRNAVLFFLTSITGLYFISHLLTVGFAVIGVIMLIVGEWYAREIKEHPTDETFVSVVYGFVMTGAGISAASAWILIVGAGGYLQPFVWMWTVILTGFPMIQWQREKKREQVKENARRERILGR